MQSAAAQTDVGDAPTRRQIWAVAWLLIWRTTLFFTITSLAIDFASQGAASSGVLELAKFIINLTVNLAVMLLATKAALAKRYPKTGFDIVVIADDGRHVTVTPEHVQAVAWLLYWRLVVLSGATASLYVAVMIIAIATLHPPPLGWAVALPIFLAIPILYYLVTRQALTKHYYRNGFRLVLLDWSTAR